MQIQYYSSLVRKSHQPLRLHSDRDFCDRYAEALRRVGFQEVCLGWAVCRFPWKARALSLLDCVHLFSAHKGIYGELVAHW